MPISKRSKEITAFLRKQGWGEASRTPVAGDASSRRYERLKRGNERAVLMDAPAAEGIICPPDADGDARCALGYTATARLAGTNPHAFICLATALTRRGFSAPEVLGADPGAGLILMEDFGERRVAEILQETPALEREIYEACIDALAAIYRSSFSKTLQAGNSVWPLQDYDALALLAETDQFLDWFVSDHGDVPKEARQEWKDLLEDSFQHLSAHPPGLALRDFHAENIFWLPARQGTAKIGLIDFQDALFVHPAYDLVSLIEDLRRDVSPDLAALLIERFLDKTGLGGREAFMTAYNVLGVQRNAKILGFCMRMKKQQGKPQYETMMHRAKAHFTRDLSDPKLHKLKNWVGQYAPHALADKP